MLRAELIDSADALRAHAEAWDALAVEAGRPYSAPAWMLAWWRHAAPQDAELRAVLAWDGDRLAGIAPLFEHKRAYELLATGTLRIGPLGGDEASAAIAEVLAERRPDLIRLEGLPASDGWARRLQEAWPGRRPWLHRRLEMDAPTVSLEVGSYDDWLATRSSNFRQQMRRGRRKLEKLGATFRMSAEPEIERDLAAFARLHHARWAPRGGSGALTPEIERMLPDIARALLPLGRFRLWCLDAEGETVGAQLCLAAGAELSWWLGGHDEAWSAHKPAMQLLLAAIEDGIARGERRFDLGGGGQEFKYRFADSEDSLEWHVLVPPGPRAPLTRARLAPGMARRALSGRMSPEAKERLKRIARR